MSDVMDGFTSGLQPVDWEDFFRAMQDAKDQGVRGFGQVRTYNIEVVHKDKIFVHIKAFTPIASRAFDNIDLACAFVRADIEAALANLRKEYEQL